MNDQFQFLRFLVENLDEIHVPYMLTGSLAMAVYATPRMTRDIDVVVQVGDSDVERLVCQFQNTCYIDRDSVAQAVAQRGMFNIIHNELISKADFVVRKQGGFWETEFSRRRRVTVENLHVFVVAPEDLILNKMLWAAGGESEYQVRDVTQLLREAENLDFQYLERWSKSLEVYELLDRLVSQ